VSLESRSHLSAAELSAVKDHNKATAAAVRLQRSNTLICFTEHTLKRNENEALFCYATLKGAVNPNFLNLTTNREKFCL